MPLKEHKDFYKEYKKVVEMLVSECPETSYIHPETSYIQVPKLPWIGKVSKGKASFPNVPYNEYKLKNPRI